MGLFGKKKKQDNIIYNLDGQPILDKEHAQFLQPFDTEQRQILQRFIDKSWDVRPIGYAGLSAEHMRAVQKILHSPLGQIRDVTELDLSQIRRYFNYDKDVTAYDIWKVAHTGLSAIGFEHVLRAKQFGVDMVDEIDHIADVPDELLAIISLASVCGENWCKKALRGASYQELDNEVTKLAKNTYIKMVKKALRRERADLFMDDMWISAAIGSLLRH